MSKLSSFVLSALLVVLCIWLDISLFPNVARSVAQSSAISESTSLEVSQASAEENVAEGDVAQGLANAGKELNKSEGDANEAPREEKDSDKESASDQKSIQARANSARAANENFVAEASERELTRPTLQTDGAVRLSNDQNESGDVKTAAKPQGGKYVSIPGIEMDPIKTAKLVDNNGSLREDVDSLDVRVIGARRSTK